MSKNLTNAYAFMLMGRISAFRETLNVKQKKDFDALMAEILSAPMDEDEEEGEEDVIPRFVEGFPSRRLTVKVQLNNVKPAIWRKLEIPSALTLEAFAYVINIAMGWDGGHLHGFRVGREEIEDEEDTAVGKLLRDKGDKLTYEYDYGDGWGHKIELIAAPIPGDELGVRLLKGKNACPPEDFGGPWYYNDFLQAWNAQDDAALEGEFAETVEWLEEDFDPTEFDPIPFQEELDDFMANGRRSLFDFL